MNDGPGWPEEIEDGADFPGIDGVGDLDIAIGTIEIDGREEIKGFSPGSGENRNHLTAGLRNTATDGLAKFCILLDGEDGRDRGEKSSGIHDRILQLRLRSWAQGQEKESDIASGDPLARGARTLRQG
jgi:hypothetical protein